METNGQRLPGYGQVTIHAQYANPCISVGKWWRPMSKTSTERFLRNELERQERFLLLLSRIVRYPVTQFGSMHIHRRVLEAFRLHDNGD